MEELEFKKILFEAAFCCLCCDGHIDDREIEELKFIDKNTSYFEDVDMSNQLDVFIDQLSLHGKKTIEHLFNKLESNKLNAIQELLLLEVTLRIIYADDRVDENEIKFLNMLRSKLDLHNETIIARFGKDELLFGDSYRKELNFNKTLLSLSNNFEIPQLKIIKDINLTK